MENIIKLALEKDMFEKRVRILVFILSLFFTGIFTYYLIHGSREIIPYSFIGLISMIPVFILSIYLLFIKK